MACCCRWAWPYRLTSHPSGMARREAPPHRGHPEEPIEARTPQARADGEPQGEDPISGAGYRIASVGSSG